MKSIAIGRIALMLVATGTLRAAQDTEPAGKAKGFEADNIVLYQPNEVLMKRLDSADELAAYIKKLEEVCAEFFADDKAPETLHVVTAIRPGKQARIWFVSSVAQPAGKASRESLKKKLEAVTPCEVHGGPVVFAISSKLAGGDGKSPKPGENFKPPIPKEWQDAAKASGKETEVPDGMLDLVWPGKN